MKKNNNIKIAAILSAAFLTGAFVIGCGATGSSIQSALNAAAAEGIQNLISEAVIGSEEASTGDSGTQNRGSWISSLGNVVESTVFVQSIF